jgi:hypothetical protein
VPEAASFQNFFQDFPVWQYGAVGDGVTDDTDSVQEAIDAMDAANGGRVVFHPRGRYLIDGNLTLPERIGGSGSNAPIAAALFSPTPPGYVLWGDPPVNVAPSGATIVTTRTTGSPLVGISAPGGTTFSGSNDFSGTVVYVEGLTFQTGVDPNFAMLDLRAALCASVRNCGFYANTSGAPANTGGYGYRMPANGNGAFLRSDCTIASGIYNGMEVGEHQEITFHWSQNCFNAVRIPTISHAINAGVILSQTCKNTLVFTDTLDVYDNPLRVNVAELQIEKRVAGWSSGGAQILDSDDLGSGIVYYAMNSNPNLSTTFTKTGGANITATSLGAAP